MPGTRPGMTEQEDNQAFSTVTRKRGEVKNRETYTLISRLNLSIHALRCSLIFFQSWNTNFFFISA